MSQHVRCFREETSRYDGSNWMSKISEMAGYRLSVNLSVMCKGANCWRGH